MGRLTKKDYDGMLFWYCNKGGWRMKEIDKLGRYEDVDPRPNNLRKMKKEYLKYKKIEEELGIDFITLFKASKGIAVYNESKTAIEINVIPTIDLFNKRLIVSTGDILRPYKVLYFKDYGDTWALTKEGLEKDPNEEIHDNGIVVPEEILERLRHAGESAIEEKNKVLKSGTFTGDPKDYITSVTNTFIGYNDKRVADNTIYFIADRFILRDKTLEVEIDLTDQFDKFDKIVIDGIIFVKEKK